MRRTLGPGPQLLREREIVTFLLLGGPVSCVVNATVGAGTLAAAGLIDASQLPFTWSTWWVGDVIGVAVCAPLVLAWIGRPRTVWRRRRRTVAAPLALMGALVVVFFVHVSGWERRRIAFEFRARAATIVDAMRHKLDQALEVVLGLRDLYASVPELPTNGFHAFTAPALGRHPGLQALSWNPLVPAADRARFEAAAAAADPGFRGVTERAPDGSVTAAGARDHYVVVRHIAPLAGNEPAVGYDIASEPVRAATLRDAMGRRRLSVTAPLRLVQERGHQLGVLACAPVYADRAAAARGEAPLRGFATGVLRIGDIIEAAIASVERSGVAVRVHDARAGTLVFGATTADDPSPARAFPELALGHTLDVGGRPWRVECAPTTQFLELAGSWRAWTALATGLSVTALLGAFLLATTGRAVVLDRLRRERLAALAAANARLAREVAGRQHAEQALDRKEHELRHAQKMEAMGRLAGGVAHDFNNLLTPILGYAHLLEASLGPEDSRTLDVRQIAGAADRAARLTRQLLAFSRKDVVQPRPVVLNGVLGELRHLLARVLREDIELRCTLADAPWPVLADPGQVSQVIMNLVLNARDALPKGGVLTIETRNEVVAATPGGDGAGGPPPGAWVLLAVRDTGVGMSTAVQARLFEPFFTTKEVGKGTGLGLSTVYGIVTRAGGHIAVESAEGRGSAFRLYWPRCTAVPQRPTDGGEAGVSGAGVETVYVVEDEPAVLQLACAVLRAHGYVVHAATDGEAALAGLRELGDAVDLVLTDVVMPRLGGREVGRTVADRGLRARVLYMSGYADGTADEASLAPFLAKPFTPAQLLRAIRGALDEPARRTRAPATGATPAPCAR